MLIPWKGLNYSMPVIVVSELLSLGNWQRGSRAGTASDFDPVGVWAVPGPHWVPPNWQQRILGCLSFVEVACPAGCQCAVWLCCVSLCLLICLSPLSPFLHCCPLGLVPPPLGSVLCWQQSGQQKAAPAQVSGVGAA